MRTAAGRCGNTNCDVRGVLFVKKPRTRRILSLILVLGLMLAMAVPGLAASSPAPAEINIFGIGDFGGALDDSGTPTGNPGGARLVGAMKALTAESTNPVVVSGGTIYTGSAISETNHGTPVNEMLKAMGTEFANIGNHDFDWSNASSREEVFRTWQEEGGFTFLNANVYYADGEKAGQRVFTPYAVKEIAGLKVGFFGIIDPVNFSAISTLNSEGLEFRDAVQESTEVTKLLRSQEQCDIVVAMLHMPAVQETPDPASPVTGSLADLVTAVNAACKAEKLGGIDAVFGSQTVTPVCGMVGDTAVVKAKNYGTIIAQLKLEVAKDGTVTATPSLHPMTQHTDADGNSILGSSETTRENLPEDAEYKAVYDRYNAIFTEMMDAQRGIADADFSYAEGADRFAYQKWYLRQNYYYLNHVYGEPVVAYFQNTGGIRNIGDTVIRKGDPISLRLLYTVAPFDNYIVTMDMTGKDIRTLLSGSSQYGTYTTLLQYGLDVTYASGEFEANGEVTSVKCNGVELEDDQVYHIACNTFLSPGPGDNMDFSAGTNAKNINVINRNAVLEALLHRTATLESLSVAGTAVADFDPDAAECTVNVDYSVTAPAVQAVPSAEGAAVDIQAPDALSVGANSVTVSVTSPFTNPYTEPGTVQNTCTVNVVRGYSDEASVDAALLPALKTLTARGVFHGMGDGSFSPNAVMTLDQLAVTLTNAAGADLSSVDPSGVTGSAPWAAPAVAWCVQQGILTAGGEAEADASVLSSALTAAAGALGLTGAVPEIPAGPVTRAQAAQVLAQVMGL